MLGYRVSIEIECEDKDEIIAHISEIRKELIHRINHAKRNSIPEIKEEIFNDNNCYGTHIVKIEHAL